MERSYEINLIDLFFYIIQKWRILIIAMVIAALLLGGYRLFSNRNGGANKVDIKALEKQMTSEELMDVKEAISVVTDYQQMKKAQSDYNSNAILQKLDPFSIKTMKMDYYVDNYYKVSYPIIESNDNIVPIVQTYIAVLSNQKLYETMSTTINQNIKPSYFAEVVSTNNASCEYGVFSVILKADSEEILKKMSTIIDDAMKNEYENITNIYGEHKLVLTSSAITTTVDTGLAEIQKGNLQKIVSIDANIREIEDQFTNYQLDYLKASVHETVDNEANVILYTIVGAILGATVVICWCVVKYVTGETIMTTGELRKAYGLLLLGGVSFDGKKLLKFDGWLYKHRRDALFGLPFDETMNLISTRIALSAKQNDYKKICFVLSPEVQIDIKVTDAITIPNCSVVEVFDIINNANDLEEAATSDAIVFVNELEKTKRLSLETEISRANQYGVPIIGTILFG